LKLKRIRSDNAKEFLITDFFNNKGIIHETYCVETPQQNNIVERKHQHLLNVSCALLFQSHLPTAFWSFVVKHATHIINRLPNPFLKFKSPYELIHGTLPYLTQLKVFGCLGFATTLLAGRTKFDKRAIKTIFLGVKTGTKGYILYDITTNSKFISRNVTFYKIIFLMIQNLLQKMILSIIHLIVQFLTWIVFILFFLSTTQITVALIVLLLQIVIYLHHMMKLSQDSHQATDCQQNSRRTKRPPAYLSNYHCSTVVSSNTTHTTPYHLHSYLSYAKCSNHHTAFSLSLFGTLDPTSFKEANQLECWQKAMLAELEALDRNNTWSLVSHPPRKKAVGCR